MLQKGKVSVTLSKFMNRVRRAVFKWFHCEQIFFNNTFYINVDVNPSPVIPPPPRSTKEYTLHPTQTTQITIARGAGDLR